MVKLTGAGRGGQLIIAPRSRVGEQLPPRPHSIVYSRGLQDTFDDSHVYAHILHVGHAYEKLLTPLVGWQGEKGGDGDEDGGRGKKGRG